MKYSWNENQSALLVHDGGGDSEHGRVQALAALTLSKNGLRIY